MVHPIVYVSTRKHNMSVSTRLHDFPKNFSDHSTAFSWRTFRRTRETRNTPPQQRPARPQKKK
jgi:hypothetical protein